MDFSVTLLHSGSSAEFIDEHRLTMSSSVDVQEIPSGGVEDSVMEGIDVDEDTKHDARENGEAHGNAITVVEKQLDFVDYLKSPIITLLVGPNAEHTLTAHQLFLARSPYFQDIFDCSPTYDTIPLPDEDIDTVGSFLQFLYTGEYSPRIKKASSGEEILETARPASTTRGPHPEIDETGNHLLKHAKIYTLAEKLGLPELKTLSHSKIHKINSTAKGELAYARFVYANTPREDKTIRVPIASFWAHRSHILRHEAEDEFRRMVLEFPQFAYDILTLLLDQKEKALSKGKTGIAGGADDDDGKLGAIEKSVKAGRKRPRLGTLV